MKDPRSDVTNKATDIRSRERPWLDTTTVENSTYVQFLPPTNSNRRGLSRQLKKK